MEKGPFNAQSVTNAQRANEMTNIDSSLGGRGSITKKQINNGVQQVQMNYSEKRKSKISKNDDEH